ncbi:MAG: hypothetical protein MHM6MM_008943 [Cercozoa sp. M6MM]
MPISVHTDFHSARFGAFSTQTSQDVSDELVGVQALVEQLAAANAELSKRLTQYVNVERKRQQGEHKDEPGHVEKKLRQ